MKRITYPILFSLLFLFAWVDLVQAQTDTTLVNQWGITTSRHGSGWRLTVNATGDTANDHGASLKGWEGIRGAFYKPLVSNTSSTGAVVVTGKITFVGEGPDMWSALRYGVYNNLAPGTIQYAGTDSASWGSILYQGTDTAKFAGMPETSYGYSFMPQSGTTYVGNIPSGFNASQGIALNGSWISSYAGPGFGGLIQQAPARANMTAGTYDFAFSFHPLSDGTTKRVNFYLIKEGTPTPYWYGGSYVVMDTAAMVRTDTLNGVCFGVESATNMTNMIVSDVHATLGADITVPAAPFQAFYLDQWGLFGRTGGWKFKVDPDTIIGNAGIAGSKVPTGSWATIRGGFTVPVTATQSKAIIVKGQIEFVGSGPVTWSGLRYGLFNIDSASSVQYAVTDSANWGSIINKGTDSVKFVAGKENAHGYMFTPQSGTNYVGNIPAGFNASQGFINGGSWISTYSGPGIGGLIQQAPARAVFSAGLYDFAFSVQPQADGTNEIRFYMYKDGAVVTYWYGGTFKDTNKITTFNSVCFGLDPNYDQTTSPISAMKLTNVQVDLGNPITVPTAPFQAFYLDQWGMFGRTGGWHFKVDPDTIIGNAGINGSKVPTGSWATIRGGFTIPVIATQSKAIIVKGDIKFVGSGPVTWSGLRYGLFNVDSASSVQYALTDSANWGSIINKGTDSVKFVAGKENSHGYMFTPQSGTNYVGNIPSGFNASQGIINGGSWISTFSGPGFGGLIQQAPARANFSAGSYKFAFSVQPQADGTNEVRFYMYRDSSVVTYWYGGILKDTAKITTFNSVCFGLDPNYDQTTSPISSMILTNVQVDLGNPITVPTAPWQNYYASEWGFYQGQMGGWLFTPDIIGNASVSGTKPLTGLVELRGGFSGAVTPRNGVDSALVIKGNLEFDGGGFQKANSFRFGFFNNPTPGNVKIISDTVGGVVYDSTRWTGSGTNESGYLFIPTSGTNSPVKWVTIPGTLGGVLNGAWNNTNSGYALASNLQTPANAEGSAGMYDFTISVAPSGNGAQVISYLLEKTDKSYIMQGSALDTHSPLPATSFNGVIFALDTGNTTTAMKLTNVQVTMGKPLVTGIVNKTDASLPSVYSLSQNYPNPFNPTTTINFALPKSGNVTLTVYDILGREVKMLVNDNLQAGYHKVVFNASSLASGIYFYRIQAGSFMDVKKLMLLK